jgi:GT2 family glycosyltransferase
MKSASESIGVIIPSRGRPDELAETLLSIQRQTVVPKQIILAVTCEQDIKPEVFRAENVAVCIGGGGNSAQKNRGIRALSEGIEIVIFFDDDVELAPNYIEVVRSVFAQRPDLVGLNGNLLANGGVDRFRARQIIEEHAPFALDRRPKVELYSPTHGLYGCCMSMRRQLFNHIQFDERLKSYSWLEDADIGKRAHLYGTVGFCPDASLVHLGIRRGRDSGRKFGFAQIMNPVYLASTGVFRWRQALVNHVIKATAANVAGAILRDREVDRWGRLYGNFYAFAQICRGRIQPEDILNIKD